LIIRFLVYRFTAASTLRIQLGNIATIAFSSNGNEIVSGYDNGSMLRFSTLKKFEEPQYVKISNTVTHMVNSAQGQYLATATPENKIIIWRAQSNEEFEQYAVLAGYKRTVINNVQVKTVENYMITKRVLLLVLYNGIEGTTLHAYDILTQQEIREPVVVAPSLDMLIDGSMIDISARMDCVVSATFGASTVNVVTNQLTFVSDVAWQFHKLLDEPTASSGHDPVEFIKQHPTVVFQPIIKPEGTRRNQSKSRPSTLIEYALAPESDNGEQLLCLLDTDKAVLDGEQLNLPIPCVT
jgi:hypothetical protein